MALTKATYSIIEGAVFNVLDFGAVGDNTTDDTTAIQAAIDAANAAYVGGSQLGGGNEVFMPAGRYKITGLIIKNGVNLRGAGRLNTQLRVAGSGSIGLAATANSSTMTSADNRFYGFFKDFAVYSWEGANGSPATNQVGWDAIGFSRWFCENMYFGWGAGFTGIRATGAIPAGSGGPSTWYNTFIGCICEKHFVGAGGVGLLLGDTLLTSEQITTWNWIGGSIRGNGDGTGTGLNLQSGTGCTFYGVTFEANGNAILLGSAGGTRFANNIDFIGCYWEGNTVNWNIYAGCTNINFVGGFVTGGTDTDNGTATSYSTAGRTQANITGSTANDYWRVNMINGGVNRPQFVSASSVAGADFVDDLGNDATIYAAPQVSASNNYLNAYANDLTTPLWECGTGSFSPGNDNLKTLGRASFRWSTVYAATGAINTSDERSKQQIQPIDETVLRAWGKVEYAQYKFNDAVETKADSARWHFGLIAQRVKEAFESEGLDPFAYGLLCYDKWDGGDRYGIRYEEALALECAYLRSKLR